MGQKRGELDLAAGLVDRGGLDGGDLVLAEALAHDVEPAGERGIAKRPLALARERRADDGAQGFLRVGELALRLGQRGGDGADGLTGAVHRRPPGDRS